MPASYLNKFYPDKISLKHFYRRHKSMTGRAEAGRKLKRLPVSLYQGHE